MRSQLTIAPRWSGATSCSLTSCSSTSACRTVLRLVHELHAVAPDAAVVATAVAETDGEIVACAEAGVAGFVTRDQSLAEAVRVLESVACGESPCSPRTAAALLRRVAVLSAQREPPGPPDGLTPRECEIGGTNRARPLQQGNRAGAVHRDLDRQEPRAPHAGEARRPRPGGGGGKGAGAPVGLNPDPHRDPVRSWIEDASTDSWTRA